MSDLSRSGAAEGITSLNLHNEKRRSERNRLSAPNSKNREIDEG
jgi:hypothetical protein